jgi:hypothetical protein
MQRFIMPAISLILLCGCSIGPQFDNLRPVDCAGSDAELKALDDGRAAAGDAAMKGETTIAPSADAAGSLAGDYPDVVADGQSVRTSDYWSAIELRTNDVLGACRGR